MFYSLALFKRKINMVIIKNKSEIEKINECSRIVIEYLDIVKEIVKPGLTTLELNELAEKFALKNNAEPAFKGYKGFPYAICASRNSEIVHGFPSDIPLEEGDILSIDFGTYKNSYYGDSAITIPVGNIKDTTKKLIQTTEECFYKGMEQCTIYNTVEDIGYAIQEHAVANGFNVIKNFVGHGIGKNLHEAPQVKNYGLPSRGIKLKENMILCIEPMLTIGLDDNKVLRDGWTVVTKDGSLSSHFERAVLITKDKPVILDGGKTQ